MIAVKVDERTRAIGLEVRPAAAVASVERRVADRVVLLVVRRLQILAEAELQRRPAAAEQIGDLNRAVELERLRVALDRNATQARLDHLQQLQRAYTRKALLVVDQKLTADYTD